MSRHPWIASVVAIAGSQYAEAQPIFSTVPTQAVYEYQLNYELPWQRWYGGPGLSLGGTMPSQGVFGYSSLNGIPFPAPLGAGVYVNSPAPHAVNVPGGFPIGPGPMASPFAAPAGFIPPPGAMIGGGHPPLAPMNAFPSPVPSAQPVPLRLRRRQGMVSAPAARRASIEQQNAGDQKLRQQLWTQAYVHYRNSADLAPERPEAHFRLGLSFTALKQYASAIREFKRSIDLDPTLPQSGETLSTIFADETSAWQDEVQPSVADWAREDLRDTDRLFLLGLLLHFNEDPRGSEILEAARRTPGANEYVFAFLAPRSINDDPSPVPRLRREPPQQPEDDDAGLPFNDLPLPPAPAPEPE